METEGLRATDVLIPRSSAAGLFIAMAMTWVIRCLRCWPRSLKKPALQHALTVMVAKSLYWSLSVSLCHRSKPRLRSYATSNPLLGGVLASLLVSAAVIIVRIFFRRTPLNNGLLVVLLALALIFNFITTMSSVVVLFIVSGLVALLSLLQHSYDMAYRDELTGLLGRRALNERFLRLSGHYCIVKQRFSV